MSLTREEREEFIRYDHANPNAITQTFSVTQKHILEEGGAELKHVILDGDREIGWVFEHPKTWVRRVRPNKKSPGRGRRKAKGAED